MTYEVKKVTWLMNKAGRLDWAANQKGLITFDSRGPDNYYDVYTANADGARRICLTCNKKGLVPQRHNGNPAWHPSGDYIVFQAEKKEHPGDSRGASPGAGLWCDLWLTTPNGEKFYRLTDIPTDKVQGTLHPHFSHDGTKLLWAERIRGFQQEENFGKWALRIADFSLDGQPHLVNIRTFQPGKRHMWHEAHGFSPDDSKIIFSGDLEKGQAIENMDIYTLDLVNPQLTNLTANRHAWDEHAHFSPRGDKIVWMSSQGFTGKGNMHWYQFMRWLTTELWIMNPDGSRKKRLTYFNEPDHPHSPGGRVIAGDGDWNPAGDKYAVLVNVLKPGVWEERIAVIEFE